MGNAYIDEHNYYNNQLEILNEQWVFGTSKDSSTVPSC